MRNGILASLQGLLCFGLGYALCYLLQGYDRQATLPPVPTPIETEIQTRYEKQAKYADTCAADELLRSWQWYTNPTSGGQPNR